MKNAIITSTLVFLLILVSAGIFSQDKPDFQSNKHEFSLGVADLLTKNSQSYYPCYDCYLWYPYYPSYPQAPAFAVGYKFHYRNFGLRIGADLAYYSQENDKPVTYSYETMRMNSCFYTGLEYRFIFSRVYLFTGIDYFQRNKKEENISASYDNGVLLADSKSKTVNTIKENGIAPFAGIGYFIHPNFSISVSTKYSAGWYENKYKYTYGNQTSKSGDKGFNASFGPTGIISANVHF
jgi:hypothetical protein